LPLNTNRNPAFEVRYELPHRVVCLFTKPGGLGYGNYVEASACVLSSSYAMLCYATLDWHQSQPGAVTDVITQSGLTEVTTDHSRPLFAARTGRERVRDMIRVGLGIGLRLES